MWAEHHIMHDTENIFAAILEIQITKYTIVQAVSTA